MNVDINNAIGMLVPLVAIVLGIGMIIVTIVTRHRRQMQELDNRHRERMAAIEKGLDLPPDPVAERVAFAQKLNGGKSGGARYLLRGLVWLGVGLALALSDSVLGDRTYGWVAVAVGVAYLVYYSFEGRGEGPPPGSGGPPV